MYLTWSAPSGDGGHGEELALSFAKGRAKRLLILPPLFEEHNKLRYQTVEIMRRLDAAGVDVVLPDLPGCNESPAPLDRQSLTDWRNAAVSAAAHFEATHVLAIRGGALLLPPSLPGFAYAPLKGRQILRAMLRARTIAAREAGREEKADALLETGREEGLELAGWRLGAAMIRELEDAEPAIGPDIRVIEHAEIEGAPLWLRAEPSADAAQANALAAILRAELTA